MILKFYFPNKSNLSCKYILVVQFIPVSEIYSVNSNLSSQYTPVNQIFLVNVYFLKTLAP